MSLTERLMKSGLGTTLVDSSIFKNETLIRTDLPMLNIAFSGDVEGGFYSGITIIAGESKTFKTALTLYCLSAYLREYPEAVGILYDTEFGLTPDYIEQFGIDPSRIIHIPIENVEQLKFDIMKKLNEIQKGDKVFIMVDSIGQLASKKEVEDALNEKSAADMSRAKAIRSLLRMITVPIAMKEIPCFMINHVYMEIGQMYPKVVIPGGNAVTYSANTIFVITKSQEKQGTEIAGWNFTLTVHKSRMVRERSRLPIQVMYENGLQKWAGMLDLALEMGYVEKPKQGWYTRPCVENDKNWREKDSYDDSFWKPVFERTDFASAITSKYKLCGQQSTQNVADVDGVIDD